MEVVLGIILLVSAVFLVIAVLMQSGKSHNLSGTIAGGAETFFGKTKGKTLDKMLEKLTTVVSVFFVLTVVVMYVMQPETAIDYDEWFDDYMSEETTAEVQEETSEDEVTAEAEQTAAETLIETEAIDG